MSHNTTTTADYPTRPETITEERRNNPFAFNELVAIFDDAGQDTGQRGRYVGREVDMFNWTTGKAHISIVNGANVMIDPKYLRSVKH